MDHYKVLGLTKSASKEEIKQAFRKLAMEFHPDKHAHSSNQLKENATFKFKQVSEAYEILIDDRKRADYNIKCNNSEYCNQRNKYYYQNGYRDTYGYGYGYSRGGGGSASIVNKFEMVLRFMTTRAFLLNAALAGTSKYYQNVYRNRNSFGYGYGRAGGDCGGVSARIINNLRCVLLGATYVIDAGGEALWKMQNSGILMWPAIKPTVHTAFVKLGVELMWIANLGQSKSFEEAMESVEKAKAFDDKR
ncbi:putative presenilin-like protein-like [Capsicum annuum]|nr:putative presenilin-like protein-like [Capsicum annuum]